MAIDEPAAGNCEKINLFELVQLSEAEISTSKFGTTQSRMGTVGGKRTTGDVLS
jgi:hypothetical protein